MQTQRGQLRPAPQQQARKITEPLVGLGTALLGCLLALLPYDIERVSGLPLLVSLRDSFTTGVASSLPVAIVALNHDQAALERLHLASDYNRWPRDLHADVVDKLSAAGARVIAFDVIFGANALQTEAGNAKLAAAIRRSGRVILGAKIEARSAELGAPSDTTTVAQRLAPVSHDDRTLLTLSECRLPLPQFAQAATAVAPFQLPPQAVRVDTFWTFVETPCNLPSLPAAALQWYLRDSYEPLLARLKVLAPDRATGLPDRLTDVSATMMRLKDLFDERPDLIAALGTAAPNAGPASPRSNIDMPAMLDMYDPAQADVRNLNFIGPALSVPTFGLTAVYELPSTGPAWEQFKTRIADKVVFVGASETDIENQKNSADAFSTVYDTAKGMRLQGVEIAANAFINLLYRNALQRCPTWLTLALIVGHSLLLTAVWQRFGIRKAAFITGAGLAVYAGLSTAVFTRWAWWPPVLIPIIQSASGASLAWLAKYLEAARERSGLIRAVSKRLPPAVVRDFVVTGQIRRTVYGVCLASDIGGWTKLARTLSEEELSDLMRAYYGPLYNSVEKQGGFVIDTAGDGMLVMWVQEDLSPVQLRSQACLGALDLGRVIAEFNARSPHRLETRLGLHWGKLVLRDIGDEDEFDLKAFGIAVNTASRIENLNKWVGTQLLVSAEATAGLQDFLWRPMGRFLLEGLDQPLELFELLGLKQDASAEQLWLCDKFAAAMAAFRNHYFEPCRAILDEILERRPDDGPSLFYRPFAAAYAQEQPQQEWDGVILAPKTGPVLTTTTTQPEPAT